MIDSSDNKTMALSQVGRNQDGRSIYSYIRLIFLYIVLGSTTTTALIRRFPGFALGYSGGKRAEQKFQPSKICQQYMNKQFDEVI